jgi:hypothetical protein
MRKISKTTAGTQNAETLPAMLFNTDINESYYIFLSYNDYI